jgi:hypothetical protein
MYIPENKKNSRVFYSLKNYNYTTRKQGIFMNMIDMAIKGEKHITAAISTNNQHHFYAKAS